MAFTHRTSAGLQECSRVPGGPWGSSLAGSSYEALLSPSSPVLPTRSHPADRSALQAASPCAPPLLAAWGGLRPAGGAGQKWEGGGQEAGVSCSCSLLAHDRVCLLGPLQLHGSEVGMATLNSWSVDAHPPLFVLFTLASPLGSIFSKASLFKRSRRPESYWVSVGQPPPLLPARGFQKSLQDR